MRAQGMQSMLDRLQKEYAGVAENCRQLERANAAMELQLERAKASGAQFFIHTTCHILDPLHDTPALTAS